MSLPEVLLWQELRRRPGGLKFRRQVPMAPYTADFTCLSARLIIEVDGESKYRASGTILMDRRALLREKRRENAIRALGFRVLRLEWADVIDPQRFVAALRSVGALR